MIDYQIPKTAGLAGLEGLPNLLHKSAEGLVDFGEILAFICKTLETRRICSCCYSQLSQSNHCRQALDSSSSFSNKNLIFYRMNPKPAALKKFVFDWALCFRFCEVYLFQNLVGLESPIKHTLKLQTSKTVEKRSTILNRKDYETFTSTHFCAV